MNVNATDEQLQGVAAMIAQSPLVARSQFIDRNQAFKEFTKVFRDNPDVSKDIRPEDLPTSFRVGVRSGVDGLRQFIDWMNTVPGVQVVASVYDLCVGQPCQRQGKVGLVAPTKRHDVRAGGAIVDSLRSMSGVADASFCLTKNVKTPTKPDVVFVAWLKRGADEHAFVRRARALPDVRAVEVRS